MTEPRFLLVTLRRIQIIDRHPEDGDEPPSNATTPRYVIPSYAARPADHRPEVHTYDQVLAVPELAVTTFEATLDEARGYRMLFATRGWTVAPDGKLQVDGEATTSWAIEHSTGGAEGPNPWSLQHTVLAPDAWHGFDVMRARDQHFAYYELQEVRLGPISAQPPSQATRGVPDTLGEQHKKELEWTAQARRVVLP